MNDEARRTLINIGFVVAWLVSVFVVLPWVIDELGAIPLSDVPSLLISGFGLAAWMLFRIEQAINRGNAMLAVSVKDACRDQCEAVGRVEFDTSTIRDTLEQGLNQGNGTTNDIVDQLGRLRGDLNDVVKLLEDIRGAIVEARPGVDE
jgi:hypothetical protein